VILWGWGVMNATALKTAQKVGFPREKMVGNGGRAPRSIPKLAEGAANGYYAASLNLAGTDFPVVQDVQKLLVAKGKSQSNPKLSARCSGTEASRRR
jgi:branched-chain amino acid transport system substrate-binding protein